MRHTIETPQIASVGDREPEIVQRAVMIIVENQLADLVVSIRNTYLAHREDGWKNKFNQERIETFIKGIPFIEKTMRNLRIRAFGITRDIVKGRELSLETSAGTVGELKEQLQNQYPELRTLKSFFIAVDNTYAADGFEITDNAEIALIPPVSGG